MNWVVVLQLVVPHLSVEIEVEEVIEIHTSLTLVTSEKVEAVHVSYTTSSASGLDRLSRHCTLQLFPFISPNTVRVQIIQSLFIIRPSE